MSRSGSESVWSTAEAAYGSLVQPGCCVLLAVSGGSDSLALMHLSAGLAAKLNLKFHVGFVDHGLRPEVLAERRLVEEQATCLGIDFHGIEIPAEEARKGVAGNSLQQWARNERYRRLEELALSVGASHIATGHTLDDQAETFLLRLLRGTGLDGLRCIPWVRPLGQAQLIRPLLGVRRVDLQEYLRVEQLRWVDDPSNEDPRYQRVRVRRQLLPLMEELQSGVATRLGELVQEIEAISKVVDLADEVKERGIALKLSAGIKVPRAHFDAMQRELWPRLVREALAAVRGDLRRIERIHVDQLVEQVARRAVTAGTELPGTAIVYAHRGDLYVFRDRPLMVGAGECQVVRRAGDRLSVEWLKLGVRADVRWEGAWEVGSLAFRVWQPADRLYDSRSSLKKTFQQGGVPPLYREIYPVVLFENRVVAALDVVPSRLEGLWVDWVLDENSPFKDLL